MRYSMSWTKMASWVRSSMAACSRSRSSPRRRSVTSSTTLRICTTDPSAARLKTTSRNCSERQLPLEFLTRSSYSITWSSRAAASRASRSSTRPASSAWVTVASTSDPSSCRSRGMYPSTLPTCRLTFRIRREGGGPTEGRNRVIGEDDVEAALFGRRQVLRARHHPPHLAVDTGAERRLDQLGVHVVVFEVEDAHPAGRRGAGHGPFRTLPGGASLMTAQNTPSSRTASTNRLNSTGLTTYAFTPSR